MRRLIDLLLFPACVALLCYFGWMYFYGTRSVGAFESTNQRIQALEAELAQARARHEAADKRVGLLRADSLDPDMLEEQARLLLNYVQPEEILINNKDIN